MVLKKMQGLSFKSAQGHQGNISSGESYRWSWDMSQRGEVLWVEYDKVEKTSDSRHQQKSERGADIGLPNTEFWS